MVEYVWLIIGLFVFIKGLVIFKRTNNFIRKSELIKGKVIELKQKGIVSGSGIITFIPIIEYVDKKDGLVKTFESNVGLSEGKISIGDTLEVCYFSEVNDSNVMINHWLAKWGGLIVSVAGGIIIISCGIWFYTN